MWRIKIAWGRKKLFRMNSERRRSFCADKGKGVTGHGLNSNGKDGGLKGMDKK